MKQRFKFIGDSISSKRVKEFIVEVDEKEFSAMRTEPLPSNFLGKVVETKDLKSLPIGYQSYFVNPYYEMMKYGWPVFVRVPNY